MIDSAEEDLVSHHVTIIGGFSVESKQYFSKKYWPARDCTCKNRSCERFLIVTTGLGNETVTLCEGTVLEAAKIFNQNKDQVAE